ncbi:MAG: helix-turn-helix transcriptional regulator [Phycisphaerales bacterium]
MAMRQITCSGLNTREWIVTRTNCPVLAEHYILAMGAADAGPGYQFVWDKPPFQRVMICHAGRGEVLIDGRWTPCPPGTAYATAPHTTNGHRTARSGRWGVCWVRYEVHPKNPVHIGGKPYCIHVDPHIIRTAILGLHRETQVTADPALMRYWVRIIHGHVMRMLHQPSQADRLWPLWETVRGDMARKWALEELAEVAKISKEHLRRICQRKLGRSPMRHLTHLRMQHAATLLESTERTIIDIALATGYDNAFAFSVAFRRHMGLPPSIYRGRKQA